MVRVRKREWPEEGEFDIDKYIGFCLICNMPYEQIFRALASRRRLLILAWLKHPAANFPPQVDGDLVADGVCGLLIARKLRVSQPTASEHLKQLRQAGLLKTRRIKQWTFYRRDEARIQSFKQALVRGI